MKTTFLILAAATATATFATHLPVQAQAGGSLNDARMAIIKGTAPGIVIIGAKRSPQEVAAAASAASAAGAAPTAAMAPATAAAPLAERLGALLKWGDPPRGQPLNAARRLDSPTLGIALPSAGSASSQPAAK